MFGIFAEKTFGKMSLFINAENITDTRQSRFGPVEVMVSRWEGQVPVALHTKLASFVHRVVPGR